MRSTHAVNPIRSGSNYSLDGADRLHSPSTDRTPRKSAPVALGRQTSYGELVVVRQVRPDDASLEQEFVRTLSPESRYARFMGTVRELTPETLRRLTEINYECDMAFIAVVWQGSREAIIGDCRCLVCAGGNSCEFAIAIADAWQRRGLGRYLMSRLIDSARARGLKEMLGTVLATNVSMLALAATLGFEVSDRGVDPSLIRISLQLAEGRAPGAPVEMGLRAPPTILRVGKGYISSK